MVDVFRSGSTLEPETGPDRCKDLPNRNAFVVLCNETYLEIKEKNA